MLDINPKPSASCTKGVQRTIASPTEPNTHWQSGQALPSHKNIRAISIHGLLADNIKEVGIHHDRSLRFPVIGILTTYVYSTIRHLQVYLFLSCSYLFPHLQMVKNKMGIATHFYNLYSYHFPSFCPIRSNTPPKTTPSSRFSPSSKWKMGRPWAHR